MNDDPELEYYVKVLDVDENVLTEIGKVIADGWMPMAGIKPVAIYHFSRPKAKPPEIAQDIQPDVGGALGIIHVDETKALMIRANGDIEDHTGKVIGRVPKE